MLGPLELIDTGSSGSASDLVVKCTNCHKQRQLGSAFQKDAINSCTGRRPWLAPMHYEAGCGQSVKTILRSASNAYFSVVSTALSIPPWSDPIHQELARYREPLIHAKSLDHLRMVGDRGMITSARIGALRELDEDYGWITALRGPAIKKLMADDGPLQLSLSGEQDLAEITSPDFPGERLVACRNPVLAAERARKREDLLAATERLLRPLIDRVAAGRLRGADAIGLAVGKVIGTHKMAKHLAVTITDTSLAIERRQDQIEAEAALDGIYVIRAPVPQAELGAGDVVTAYKNLKHVERDFRHIKADDLDLRPVFHRLTRRVKAHVLICMLAAYLVWHLRRAWAPLTYTDEDPPARPDPVAPARRSEAAQAKASAQHDQDGRPYRSFRGLLAHLATLTRNQVRFAGTPATVPVLAEPTSEQRQAFDLIGVPIPLALT